MMTLKDFDLVGSLHDIPNHKVDPEDLGSARQEPSPTRSILQTELLSVNIQSLAQLERGLTVEPRHQAIPIHSE